jgi:glycerol-3-phosphate dehydrogenase
LPRLEATRRDVLRVFSGALPAVAPGSSVPRPRNLLSDYGPRGLVTVSGTKFTTARSAARQVLAAIFGSGALRRPPTKAHAYPSGQSSAADGLFSAEWTIDELEERRPALRRILEQEAVEHLDDLVLRRTTLGDQPMRALSAARALCGFDGRWRNEVDRDREVARLSASLGWRQAAWAMNKPGHDPEAAAVRTA